MTDRLLQLYNLMSGGLDSETPASAAERERVEKANEGKRPSGRIKIPPGFVEGSEAWNVARHFDWPLLEMLPTVDPEPQGDMFADAPPLARRFVLDNDFMDTGFPIRVGGEPPDGAVDSEELCMECSAPFAWDAEHVLTACPRGWCLIERSRWQEGWRHCPGC